MLPIFPLGVKKDVAREEPWPLPPPPNFMPGKLLDVIGGTSEAAPRFCDGFPQHAVGRTTSASSWPAPAATARRRRRCCSPGRRSTRASTRRTSRATARSRAAARRTPTCASPAEEVLSPAAPGAARARGVQRAEPREVRPARAGGRRRRLRQLGRPRAARAAAGREGGRRAVHADRRRASARSIVKNIVALGALQEATRLFPQETFLTAIRQALADKCALIPLNEEAFAVGRRRPPRRGRGTRERRARCCP